MGLTSNTSDWKVNTHEPQIRDYLTFLVYCETLTVKYFHSLIHFVGTESKNKGIYLEPGEEMKPGTNNMCTAPCAIRLKTWPAV